MENIHQFERRKQKIRGAVDKWASTHRKEFVLMDKVFVTHVDKETDAEVIDSVIIKVAPIGDLRSADSYPVSMVHLGEEPDLWIKKLNLKVNHLKKKLRMRSTLAHDTGRQNLPAAS